MSEKQAFPGFDRAVPAGGYLWWYVDALSDDGQHGLTLIAFIGSVFSPYYALARRRGAPDPEHYCSLNVALYGAAGKRWTLTERGRRALRRDARRLLIGPSSLAWDGQSLQVDIDEVTVPLPSRVRGRVRLTPRALVGESFALDERGAHRWSPMAACARVEVVMEQPDLRWSGEAYLDCNAGDEPLEQAFSRWDWSRTRLASGETVVFYDVERRQGPPLALGVRVGTSGATEPFAPPPRSTLPSTTIWRIERGSRGEPGHPVRVERTLEDTPFYARSVVTARIAGEPVTSVHESLSLDRFRSGWVQVLLPFRMPRRSGPR